MKQTLTIKGDKSHHFVVFGDSLSDQGVQDLFPNLVNALQRFAPQYINKWPKLANANNKTANYTTLGGEVWASSLSKLLGQSLTATGANNVNYIKPVKIAYPAWYAGVNLILWFRSAAIDTQSATLNGNNYAQGGATTTCAGINFIVAKSSFDIFPQQFRPPGNVPLYMPLPIGPVPKKNGETLYSCPKASGDNENLQFVYDQLEKENQIDSYLKTMPFNVATGKYEADPDKVYILWGGANNLLIALKKTPSPSATEVSHAMKQAASDIVYDVEYLAAHGARKFVVLLLPNVGLTPLAIAAGKQSALEKASVAYNTTLNNMLGALQKQDSTIKIVPIDVFNLMNDIVANYEISVLGKNYQFDDVSTPACTQSPVTQDSPLTALTNSALLCTPQANNKKHLFEDMLHPTAAAHQVIAAKIAKAMEAFD
nr:SGNH/GDSL hydrolase family protein [Cysteiniphilum sp. 19X3-34]